MYNRVGSSRPQQNAPDDGPRHRVLVVGVDGSNTSWRALYYAFGQARHHHTRVIAVHAISIPIANESFYFAQQHAAQDFADELRSALGALEVERGVALEFVCRTGNPANVLIQVAVRQQADALIVGASLLVRHRLLGSTALRTVRRSPVPVTVVP
jgi:nucleotide-binding universal stress UspA family protein